MDTPRHFFGLALASVLLAGGGSVANEALLRRSEVPLNLQNVATCARGRQEQARVDESPDASFHLSSQHALLTSL